MKMENLNKLLKIIFFLFLISCSENNPIKRTDILYDIGDEVCYSFGVSNFNYQIVEFVEEMPIETMMAKAKTKNGDNFLAVANYIVSDSYCPEM
jgi:hypothetical protein